MKRKDWIEFAAVFLIGVIPWMVGMRFLTELVVGVRK